MKTQISIAVFSLMYQVDTREKGDSYEAEAFTDDTIS